MWFEKWFNEDYLKLYSNRSYNEAVHQVHFLISALHLKGSERILDLGCGAGRHAVAFGQQGFSVVGVDLSPSLIAEAKSLLKEMGPLPVTFLERDLFHLEEMGKFDLVVSLFTSFGYFEKDDENARLLQTVHQHLEKGGKFFLDFLHPSQVKRDLVPIERRKVEGETVEIHKELQRERIVKKIFFPGREYEERVKLYSRVQIEKMLEENGFRIKAVWNDYQGNPWKEEGDRQLFYALSL